MAQAMVRPTAGAMMRSSAMSLSNWSKKSDCAPSESACSGSLMHFEEQAVGAGGNRGARHGRNFVADPGAVRRVGNNRQDAKVS